MKITLPNFLIIGAAKSGTTSLYYYVKQHPEIYMSRIKEPKFITSQFLTYPFNGMGDDKVENKIIKTWDHYKKLFDAVKNEKVVGEASADNLYYHDESIMYIKKYFGDVDILIILRNPIDRAFSSYLHLVRDGRECLSFEDALKFEKERIAKNWEFIWHYASAGFYFRQVKAYLNKFSRVRIYLCEDLKNNAQELMKDVYSFLSVDTGFCPNLGTRYNVSEIPKYEWLQQFMNNPSFIKTIISLVANAALTEEGKVEIKERIKASNLRKIEMKSETREYLKRLYYEDIMKLQDLIKRDLLHWLR